MNRPETMVYKGMQFIKGLHGVPPYLEYKDTKPEDWYWKKNTTLEDNAFIWWDMSETDSRKWRGIINLDIKK